MKSSLKLGYIGLRLERRGKAAKWLKLHGWMTHHAQCNNRNAFDAMLPGKTKADFLNFDWKQLEDMGAVGIGMWFTDLQCENNAGITDKQWQERKQFG